MIIKVSYNPQAIPSKCRLSFRLKDCRVTRTDVNWKLVPCTWTCNIKSPNLVHILRTRRSPFVADRRLCPIPAADVEQQRSARYRGANPRSDLNVSRHSLNSMRCITGSQWSRSRISGVTSHISDSHIAAWLTHLELTAVDQGDILACLPVDCCSSRFLK